uniref:U1-theraphotoxin-Lsp1c n=1 Tax=Lasiodora sp. (strain IBSP 8539) TaxID=300858 RepID=TXLT3_LASSB|nr:RecName: Full=U1-theraphotoxin-Lsp1c; Short=U1-TRTX-Lsp1c; AltName: Full=LTx3; Flags: Precursor [Lasiodora sp. IBSP 8539]AAV68328.1 LTx3 toxin [Lasiodora sp. IBSP 8539]
MRKITIRALLLCSLLLVFHTSAAAELQAQEGHLMIPGDTDTALETVDDERFFECTFECDIKKEGKPCKPKGCKCDDKDNKDHKKCSGGWRCKLKLCLKF